MEGYTGLSTQVCKKIHGYVFTGEKRKCRFNWTNSNSQRPLRWETKGKDICLCLFDQVKSIFIRLIMLLKHLGAKGNTRGIQRWAD